MKLFNPQVPGSKDPNETFLTLAFESAILALGKQRIMPQGLYSQHLICKQQDQLIARLRNVDLDQLLVEIIKNLSTQMMDGGPTSGFGESIHPESVPMHTLARFLFASLLNQHPDLAFKIGLRAMRLHHHHYHDYRVSVEFINKFLFPPFFIINIYLFYFIL